MEYSLMPNQHSDPNDPLRGKKTGKWTKYGGAVHGLIKEKIEDTWCCQICGKEQPKELKPFLAELYPGDFIRVCNLCEHPLHTKTVTIHRLITITRTRG